MKIRFLGAHCYESMDTRFSSILIDDKLAVDAGALTSGLSFAEQDNVESILLTHGHYDHIRDVPAFALRNSRRTTDVYATPDTLDILSSHMIDGTLYPEFVKWPSADSPALKLNPLEALTPTTVSGFEILPVPVKHALPAVGYQITSPQGHKIFFSGDTGPGLAACWEQIEPQLLIMDMNYSNKSEELAPKPGHLCPSLLAIELMSFYDVRGYLPVVILTHMNPHVEEEISQEIEHLAEKIDLDIILAYEGMELEG